MHGEKAVSYTMTGEHVVRAFRLARRHFAETLIIYDTYRETAMSLPYMWYTRYIETGAHASRATPL